MAQLPDVLGSLGLAAQRIVERVVLGGGARMIAAALSSFAAPWREGVTAPV
jgi:hypothetical protein